MLVSNYLKRKARCRLRRGLCNSSCLRFTYLCFINGSILKYYYCIINNQKADEEVRLVTVSTNGNEESLEETIKNAGIFMKKSEKND